MLVLEYVRIVLGVHGRSADETWHVRTRTVAEGKLTSEEDMNEFEGKRSPGSEFADPSSR